MINSLFEKMFGKWEIISSRPAEADMGGWFARSSVDCMVVIQQNTKTNKKRAYIEFIDGTRKEISVSFAEGGV